MARINLPLMLLGLSFLTAAAQTSSNTGRWILSANYLGTPLTPVLNLEQSGEKVTATSRGYKYAGTLHGTALHLLATDEQGNTDEIAATLFEAVLNEIGDVRQLVNEVVEVDLESLDDEFLRSIGIKSLPGC